MCFRPLRIDRATEFAEHIDRDQAAKNLRK